MLGNNKNPNFVQFVVFGKYDFNAVSHQELLKFIFYFI